MPAITRSATLFPKTVAKNKTPISRLLFAFDTTQNYVSISLLHMYTHYVGLTYAALTRTDSTVAINIAVNVALAKFFLGL